MLLHIQFDQISTMKSLIHTYNLQICILNISMIVIKRNKKIIRAGPKELMILSCSRLYPNQVQYLTCPSPVYQWRAAPYLHDQFILCCKMLDLPSECIKSISLPSGTCTYQDNYQSFCDNRPDMSPSCTLNCVEWQLCCQFHWYLVCLAVSVSSLFTYFRAQEVQTQKDTHTAG